MAAILALTLGLAACGIGGEAQVDGTVTVTVEQAEAPQPVATLQEPVIEPAVTTAPAPAPAPNPADIVILEAMDEGLDSLGELITPARSCQDLACLSVAVAAMSGAINSDRTTIQTQIPLTDTLCTRRIGQRFIQMHSRMQRAVARGVPEGMVPVLERMLDDVRYFRSQAPGCRAEVGQPS